MLLSRPTILGVWLSRTSNVSLGAYRRLRWPRGGARDCAAVLSISSNALLPHISVLYVLDHHPYGSMQLSRLFLADIDCLPDLEIGHLGSLFPCLEEVHLSVWSELSKAATIELLHFFSCIPDVKQIHLHNIYLKRIYTKEREMGGPLKPTKTTKTGPSPRITPRISQWF